MPINVDDLTVPFDTGARGTLLEDWQWLLGSRRWLIGRRRRLPILVCALGDAFVQDVDDGSVHLLDTGAGVLERVADSAEAFRGLLRQPDFVASNFRSSAAAELRDGGRVLAPGQVWGFIHPPALGGTYRVDNYEPTDMVVHFSIQGQIHQQIKDLPPGTSISSIKLR